MMISRLSNFNFEIITRTPTIRHFIWESFFGLLLFKMQIHAVFQLVPAGSTYSLHVIDDKPATYLMYFLCKLLCALSHTMTPLSPVLRLMSGKGTKMSGIPLGIQRDAPKYFRICTSIYYEY